MMRGLLVRGMVAGLVAGLAYFAFAYLFAEPSIDAAIAYEEQLAAAAGEAPDAPLVSRSVQSSLGLAVAALIYGAAVGGALALVYAAVHGRIGRTAPRPTALAIAVVGFVAIALVPFLKYPANPPASTEDGTVGFRTGLFLLFVVGSVALAVAATALGRRLATRFGVWESTLLAAGTYVAAVGSLGFLLPAVAETPADFPADVLYDFRVTALGGQLVLWLAVGLMFGVLADGLTRRRADALQQ